MTNESYVVFNTCPDADCAARIARAVVEQRLAACANILPGLRSIYTWQGAVEDAEEHLLIIKTTARAYPALQQAIAELHPYELPEIIAVPITSGLPGYLAWLDQSTAPI